jgi:8-oxo-dGTP pyrophosphatase MutT (NUDIX family)
VTRWRVHGERPIYESPWLQLALADVELEPGHRIQHHVIRTTAPAVALVVRERGRILMLYRHRFIPDCWGWEVPAGRIDPGETVEAAAAREALEETGWRPGPPARVASGYVAPGLTDLLHHVCLAEGAEHVGEPAHGYESTKVEWVPEDRVWELIRAGEVPDGFTQYALLAVRLLA